MTAQVTGLRIRRRTEPWQGNGFTTRTLWTATYEGETIGEYVADGVTLSWALTPSGGRIRPIRLAEWRDRVVRTAEWLRYGRIG